MRNEQRSSLEICETEARGFVNPYNFVRVNRLESASDRRSVAHTHERFHADCLTGRIKCGLRIVTPLFIPDPEETTEVQGNNPKEMRFNRVNGELNIPATSIKGMVRSILETISNSCFSVLDTAKLSYRSGRTRRCYGHSPADLLPTFLRPCRDTDALCPACRIFGMVGENRQALKGKVSFAQARLVSEPPKMVEGVLLKILGSPQPTSTNFYLMGNDYDNAYTITVAGGGYDKANAILRGRKFYWLRDSDYTSSEPSNLNSRVELLQPPADFRFSVDFENLTEEELELLILALELERGMFHRLGMGKPLGLGAVGISILDGSFHVDIGGIKRYYQDMDCSLISIMTRFDAQALKKSALQRYCRTTDFSDLKLILSIDGGIAPLVRYPEGFQWFLDHADEQLYTIEEIKQGQRQTG